MTSPVPKSQLNEASRLMAAGTRHGGDHSEAMFLIVARPNLVLNFFCVIANNALLPVASITVFGSTVFRSL